MAPRDDWDDARWRDAPRDDERRTAPRPTERFAGPRHGPRGPATGPTGVDQPYNQAGDIGPSGRYYEDAERRASYGGFESGHDRDDRDESGAPVRPPTLRQGDNEPALGARGDPAGGPYGDYGRVFSGYGAGGGYTPDYREGLGRERRSWGGRAETGEREPAQGRSHRGRGPKGYQRSDERICEDISDRLTDDPVVDASEIEVRVAGSEVTLNGTVASRTEKRRAEDIAEDVSGVTHVQNNLRVDATPRPGSLAAQNDPRVAAVSEGKDADQRARDLAAARNEGRREPPRR
jgi:hypothetical protein